MIYRSAAVEAEYLRSGNNSTNTIVSKITLENQEPFRVDILPYRGRLTTFRLKYLVIACAGEGRCVRTVRVQGENMRIRIYVISAMIVSIVAITPLLGQVNTADLTVRVLDPQQASIIDAVVTVKNQATGATRLVKTDQSGNAVIVGLPPGTYEVSVEATGFNKIVNPDLTLTIGQSAEYRAMMKIATGAEVLIVTGTAELIETSRTSVSSTVDQRLISGLPINGRSYINFTLTDSQAQRDSAPSIGAAPTSGINFGGQRARSNQISVDGVDATDNSTNGVRATVSQEAVQEFQLMVSSYMPEFGRATGGVINIVTKGGTNNFHGNMFGFLRHRSIQARNPFSVEVDPVTGYAQAVKQQYTRFQGGATLGGPIRQDKTFFFAAYETTRRQETGFTNIGAGNFGLVSATTPVVPGVTLMLTPQQSAFVNNPAVLASPAGQKGAAQLFLAAGSASSVALTGVDPGLASTVLYGVPSAPGARFPLLIDCSPTAPGSCSRSNQVSLPASYMALRKLMGNYPNSEGTSIWSARLDHQWNQKNSSFVRVNATPSLVTGIQVNAQNQSLGQNAGSRTSLQQSRDFAIAGQNVTAINDRIFNEARFQYARRGVHYGYSNLPGGGDVGVNITGYAFFGREPFSTVDRIERRFQWTDNLSWTKGRHTIKFGGDANLIQIRSKKPQIFELYYGGIYSVGALTASQIGLPTSVAGVATPGVTAVQAYGLGVPQNLVQGIGNSNVFLENKTFAGFIQDSFKIHRNLTLNYGVRYDVELTPLFAPSTPMNATAQSALGVTLGIPRDFNNWSPRFALAWDPTGSGNNVIRAAYGIFFDHPLLGIAFNAITADGARSTHLISAGGSPSRAAVTPVSAAGVVNSASIFQGVLNAPANFGYLAQQQRFDSKKTDSIFVNQNFIASGMPVPMLPLTLPVAGNFRYGYAQQANLTYERSFANDYKISIAYNYTHGLKLPRPRDITPPDGGRLARNYRNAAAAGIVTSSPMTVAAPSASIAPGASTCGVGVVAPGVLGALVGCPSSGLNAGLNGQFVGTAAFFNFFRSTGPNPSFAALAGGYPNQVALAKAAGFPTGIPSVQVPWSEVYEQESSGNSVYHGMTVTFSKRFARHYELRSSWTWAHTIDDATDLQSQLAAQDNLHPNLERSSSSFDQRHRWVTSAVFQSPYEYRKSTGFWQKFLADFTVAPIFEVAAGRPYSVLTGSDFNMDLGSTDRPSIGSAGVSSPYIPGVYFTTPTVCPNDPMTGKPTNTIFDGTGLPSFFGCTGNLGRNTFTRPTIIQLDLRVARKFNVNERANIEVIGDMFNSMNRFNTADVTPLCNPLDPASCTAGQKTASLDPRLFQFAVKINW